MSTDSAAAIDDPASDIVVELIGGTGVASTFVERALKAGKPVVTANKALIAKRGVELFKLAREKNTCVAFEASAGGGIPIIDALCRGLSANRVDALLGIVNGTCNFILTKMTQNGWSYARRSKKRRDWALRRPIPPWTCRDMIPRRNSRSLPAWRSTSESPNQTFPSPASTRSTRWTFSSLENWVTSLNCWPSPSAMATTCSASAFTHAGAQG